MRKRSLIRQSYPKVLLNSVIKITISPSICFFRVNIEEQDANGMTPVMIAAEAGREKNVDHLLKAANNSRMLHVVNVVERPDRSNRSAVHYAAMNGHAVRPLGLRVRFETCLNSTAYWLTCFSIKLRDF